MSLAVYTLEQAEQWNNIVQSLSEYDVYWLSGYVKAFQIHGDGEPLMFYYENIEKTIKAVNVVIKRDISKDTHFAAQLSSDTWFDFVTPYGYGGWIIEGSNNTDDLFDEYRSWCEKNNIVSEFVRYHPVMRTQEMPGVENNYDIIALGATVAMDLTSQQTIWANLTSKNRNVIRKAEKSGVVIYNGRYPDAFMKFREIYDKTMDKDNADSYYYFESEFYRSILNDLPSEAQIFYAELNGQIIASSIILASNGKLNYHLSGSLREYQSLAPTNLLLYKAALWGSKNGCKTFHLGGGVGSHDDSLYRFKAAFYRGEPCRFHIGRKIFNTDMYNKLVEIRDTDKIGNSTYFPLYRA